MAVGSGVTTKIPASDIKKKSNTLNELPAPKSTRIVSLSRL